MTSMAATLESIGRVQRTIPDATSSLEPCSCGLGMAGHGEAYNEKAFHHFLGVERKRSEASGRLFLLLLVEFEKSSGVDANIADFAATIFSGLVDGLRDTDVIGWYRHNRIVGAVLTDLGDAPEQNVRQEVTRRVTAALHGRLPSAGAIVPQVRVYQLPALVETSAPSSVRQLALA